MAFATQHFQLVQRDIIKIRCNKWEGISGAQTGGAPSPAVVGEDFLENSWCIITRMEDGLKFKNPEQLELILRYSINQKDGGKKRGFNLSESSYC